ncbi:hypothetical protein HDV03_000236 [Kappamyces sp. JEL0829]|nr:hypothetical protein HDV03_000236 [Kappamyces sp. JEL0829]
MRRKKAKPPKKKTRSKMCWASFWIIFVFLFYSIGAFASFTAGAVLGNGVLGMGSAATDLLTATIDTANKFIPAVSTCFKNISLTINTTMDQNAAACASATSISSYSVASSIGSLADGLTYCGTQTTSLYSTASTINTNRAAALTMLNSMISTISTMKTMIDSWNAASTITYSGGSYTVTITTNNDGATASTQAGTCLTDLTSSPDGVTQCSTINGLGATISTTASAEASIASNMASLASTSVQTSGKYVKAALTTAIDGVNSGVTGALTTLSVTINSTCDGGKSSMTGFMAQVNSYNVMRGYAMIALSAVLLVIILLLLLFFWRKKAGAAKGLNLIVTPVYLLIQIVGLLMFILAILFGDVCSSVFDYTPPPINSGLPSAFAQNINQIMALRDQCSQNVSILNIAINLGMVDSSSIDISSLVAVQINAADFSSIGTLSLADVVTMSPTPSSLLSPLTSLDLSTMTSTSLSTFKTDLGTLRTNLNTLSTSITTNQGSATVNLVTGTLANAQADFANTVTTYVSNINAMTTSGGYIDQLIAYADANIAKIASLKSDLTTTQTYITSNNIVGYYTTALTQMSNYQTPVASCMTNSITTLKTNINSQMKYSQAAAYAALTCTGVGNSVFQMQNQLCGTFLGGLDSLWLSYFAIGVAAAISMPAIIFFVNLFFPTSGAILPSTVASSPSKGSGAYSKLEDSKASPIGSSPTALLSLGSVDRSKSIKITIS